MQNSQCPRLGLLWEWKEIMHIKAPGSGSETQAGVDNVLSCCSVLSHVRLLQTPWAAARQASLSFTVAWSLLKLMSIDNIFNWRPNWEPWSFQTSCGVDAVPHLVALVSLQQQRWEQRAKGSCFWSQSRKPQGSFLCVEALLVFLWLDLAYC